MLSVSTPSVLLQCRPDGVDQDIAVERLGEKCHGAGLQGPLARLVIAMSGQNDRGNSRARARQVSEKVEAIHSGQSEIEYQTPGLRVMDGVQEGLGRCEGLDEEADRSQEILQGPA